MQPWHEKVEGMIYINLDHRTDRKEQLLADIKRLNYPLDKVIRFPAITEPGPAMVATCFSHAAALRMAYELGLKNVIIYEDDCKFIDDVNFINDTMNAFFNDIKEWDALHLVCSNKLHKKIGHPLFNICVNSANAVAYLVNRHLMLELSNTIYEGGIMLHKTGQHWFYQNDVVWDRYMKNGKWYSMNHALCFQQPSYSDVSKKFIDYSSGNPMHL